MGQVQTLALWLRQALRKQAYGICFALLAALAIVLLGFFLLLTYQQTEEALKTRSANESHILAGQLDATLRRIRSNSDLMAENIVLEALSEPLSPRLIDRINNRLGTLSRYFPEILAHRFFDAEGQLIFSSDTVPEKINVVDRPYFQHSKAHPQGGIYFSETIQSKITQTPVVIASRAVVGRAGEFLGVIAIPIDLRYFEQIFANLKVGARGMVSVRRSDDSRLVVRWPEVLQGINKEALDIPPYRQVQSGISAGVVRYIGRTDGVDRIFAFNKIPEFPFFVLVGYAVDEQFAKWRKTAITTSAVTCMGLLLLGLYLARLQRSETGLRKSERQYQAIVASQPDAVCRWLPDTTLTFFNDKYADLFGTSPGGGPVKVGQRWIESIPTEQQEAIFATYASLAEQPQPFSSERSVTRQDGTVCHLHWVDVPLLEANGKCVEFQSVGRDITELKRAEEERQKLQMQLLHSQKMESIGTLAGGIAHDFNNILGVIIGYTELALKDVPPESLLASKLHKVQEASNRAATMVKQILAFSRQSVIERVPLEVASLVKEAISFLRPSLPSTITIRQQIDTATKHILADPTQVHQILINFCTNAFHAMELTGGTLEISLKDCEICPEDLLQHPGVHPGGFVELAISDTGCGIEPEIWGKIFDPYFTTKGIGKGTGMGLAIVHGIVTSYGGFITGASEPGVGTVFRVYFPALEQETSAGIEPVQTTPLGKERILLIDDEEMLAVLGKMMLESLGYTVTAQTDSAEALALFQHQPDQFDVVVTDQTMPGLTGSDLAIRMLQIRPDLPIILCTGYSSIISKQTVMAMGIKGFVTKPFSRQDIALLIRKVLEKGVTTGSDLLP